MICTNSVAICKFVPIFVKFRRTVDEFATIFPLFVDRRYAIVYASFPRGLDFSLQGKPMLHLVLILRHAPIVDSR